MREKLQSRSRHGIALIMFCDSQYVLCFGSIGGSFRCHLVEIIDFFENSFVSNKMAKVLVCVIPTFLGFGVGSPSLSSRFSRLHGVARSYRSTLP